MGDFRLRLDAKGLNRLARSLRQAGVDMTRLKADYKRMADVVKSAIKPEVPTKTGRLRRTLRDSATQKSGVVRAGGGQVPYAGPIEYGWPRHHITGQHFMEKGLMSSEDRVLTIYAQALQDALNQVKGA